ncbi:MAG TPA: hypothetical protein PLB26_17300 [Rubrivivax sp.]|nr:hypothetical protein [Rubrivivax sp.]
MGKIRSTTKGVADPEGGYGVPHGAEAVLVNWGRWAAPRHGCRRSLNVNFRFVRPDRWGEFGCTEAPAAFAAPPNVDRAWAAEKIICNPVFWPPARTLLTEHYVFARSPRSTCRLLGVHRSEYDRELWRAACMFWNRWLQQHQLTDRNSGL